MDEARPSSPVSSSESEQDLPLPPAQWDLDAHLPRLERESCQDVTQQHLILALDHVGKLLNSEGRGYPWAVMGGLAMFMHGNEGRNTRDVDITVQAPPRDIIAALTDSRIYRPPLLSMAGSGCGRFYVLTGPDYGEDVQSSHIVEVDVIMPGHLGAPRIIHDNTVTKTAHTAAGQRTYNVLSIQTLFRAKLHALDQREAERDLTDLEWFCMNFPTEIHAHTLDERERYNFVDKYRSKYPGNGEAVNFLERMLGIDTQETLV